MITLLLLACGAPSTPDSAPVSGDSSAAADSGAPPITFALVPSGVEGPFEVESGARLELDAAWVSVYSVALTGCEAARGPLLLGLVRPARASHDLNNPGATAQAVWVDLLAGASTALGEARVVAAPCGLNLLVGGAPDVEAPSPEMQGKSLYFTGRVQGGAEFVWAGTLAYDQDRSLTPGAWDAGGALRLGLDLRAALAPLDPADAAVERELLRRLVEGYVVLD